MELLFTTISSLWESIPEPMKLGAAAVMSGALGWAVKTLNDRRQLRRMRRRLYKEMAHNYSKVVDYYLMHLGKHSRVYQPDAIWRGLSCDLRTAYYDHAIANRDVFESLRESYSIDDWYKEFSQLWGPAPSFQNLDSAASILGSFLQELNFGSHGLDRRLLMKFIDPQRRALMNTALGNMLLDRELAAKWADTP